MAGSLEQFAKAVIATGLVSSEELKTIVMGLPSVKRPKDAAALAELLVQQQRLTTYQADAIQQGRAESLVLGQYVILDRIGAGGMGQVFKAQHRRMERLVALKVLPPHVNNDPAAIKRFQREVRAAAQLEHPNIVTAYDADEARGQHFLVMQYVDGGDSSSAIRDQHSRRRTSKCRCRTRQQGTGWVHGPMFSPLCDLLFVEQHGADEAWRTSTQRAYNEPVQSKPPEDGDESPQASHTRLSDPRTDRPALESLRLRRSRRVGR